MRETPIRRNNRRLMAVLFAVVVAMVGGSYASVPLYRLFCQVTGFNGTTNIADRPSDKVSARVVHVRFDATVNGVPWAFQPVKREILTHVGENTLAFYRAENHSSEPVTGMATFNVTPLKAGQYFSKIECFCFTEQRLGAGESVEMPVAFFVDPAIEKDRNMDDVTTITLSYTFYPAQEDQDKDTRPVSRLTPDGTAGGTTGQLN
ncbi:MAG: cytochrome c oxidase assembly protein [Alphaproteobacteria bacterium]|nr:cytochrome c oxidase assembly protein [Alphaproteobacteria bacterium]